MEAAARNEPDKAIDHFKRAVALHPAFGLALNELGVQYLRKGELDKAAEVLVKAIQIAPEAPEPSLNLWNRACYSRRSLLKLRLSSATR